MAGAKSCEHCGIPTNPDRRYVPPTECRQREVHGELRWLCIDCERSGAPLLKADPDFGPAPDNGTETSSQSARQSDKDVTPQCLAVLGALALAPEGLIREEICQQAGIVNQAACARLNTLEEQGLVIVDGEKRLAGTRRLQQVYRFCGAKA